jgi:CelD/BcsL family acetyltransferase involved in cellulose biosynthesis
LRISVSWAVAELDRLRPVWNHLHESSDAATLFQSFLWNRVAASVFASRQSPRVVLEQDHSGAALIPGAVSSAGLALIGEELFDYRDSLRAGGDAPWFAAWGSLAEMNLPMSFAALRGHEARRRWQDFSPSPFVTAPQVLAGEIGAEAFRAAHSRLGRTLRRLERQGAALRRRHGAECDLVRWIYRRKAEQQNGGGGNLFRDPLRVEFMAAICAAPAAACEIFTLETGSRPIAALVTFRDRRIRRFYTVWFDAAWAHLSPGTALIYEVTARSLAEGLDCDYLTDEQPHKTRFASSAVPLFRVNATPEALAQIARRDVPLAA